MAMPFVATDLRVRNRLTASCILSRADSAMLSGGSVYATAWFQHRICLATHPLGSVLMLRLSMIRAAAVHRPKRTCKKTKEVLCTRRAHSRAKARAVE